MSTAPTTHGPPTFASFLAEHRRGKLHAELGEKLAELSTEVIQKGKSGKITCTITISRVGEDQVDITDDVKLTLPKGERGKAVWFVDTETGGLTRQPPRQTTVEDELERRRAAGEVS